VCVPWCDGRSWVSIYSMKGGVTIDGKRCMCFGSIRRDAEMMVRGYGKVEALLRDSGSMRAKAGPEFRGMPGPRHGSCRHARGDGEFGAKESLREYLSGAILL